MADSILRLKVESKEYDNKLKQAANGLTRYIDECRKAGDTLEFVEKETLDYVKAVGRMDTASRTATGKLGEMKKTFVELSAQYKSLTDAEKASPFGKAISSSLDQLRPRITEAKQQLDDINRSMLGAADSSGGGLFAGMSSKMSGALQVFGGNLLTKAAGMAANFATEIGECVTQGIELAKQGEGIRNAFERLGRGDILDGLREATHGTVTDIELMKAAVKFNDFKLPIEELGTMLAFAQQKAKDTGQSVDYMVDSIVTGLGRKSLMILDNLGLSAAEVKERMAETGDMTKAVGDIIREQMANAGDYVETAADRAAQANVDLTNAMERLGETLQPLAETGSTIWNDMEIGAINLLNNGVEPLVPVIVDLKTNIADLYDTVTESSVFSGLVSWMEASIDTATRLIPPLNMIRTLMQGNDVGKGAAVGGSISGAISDNSVSKINEVVVSGNKPKGSKGKSAKAAKPYKYAGDITATDAIAALPQTAVEIPMRLVPDTSGMDALHTLEAQLASLREQQETFGGVSEEMWQGYQAQIDAVTKKIDVFKGKDIGGDANKMAKDWGAAGTAIQAVGSAMSQIQDPAAQVMGTIAQAIATIALTYAKSLEKTFGPWDWIAAAAAGAGTMISVIASIKNATGYATGGQVKGNTYSGDNIPIMVNAGETVLTAAMSNTLASAIQERGQQGAIQIEGRLSGEYIYLSAGRYTRRSGRGEIVTFKS